MKLQLLLLALLLCPVATLAQAEKASLFDGRLSLEAGAWFSTGEAEWTERGRNFRFGPVDRYRSRLDYEDLDSIVPFLAAEVRLTDALRLGARFGAGDMDDGNGADNDWVDGPGLVREFYVSRSENDLEGDTGFWDVELLYRLPVETPESVELDVFASYGNSYDEFVSTDGRQVLVDEQRVDEPIPGLNSTYDFDWNSLVIGLDGTWRPGGAWIMEGRFGIMPWVDYEGEAFWNLRDDFKGTPPNFVHEGDGGIGYEARVAVGYGWRSLQGRIGYWLRSYEVDGGTSETFFADGTSGFADLEAEAFRHGIFATLGITL